jgi:hypothetical protein
VASLDQNHNLYLTLKKFFSKSKALKKEKTLLNEQEIFDNKLIYKYDTINTRQVLEKERRAHTQFNKIIPEFIDKTMESHSEEGEESQRKKKTLEETDSSVIEDCDRRILFERINATNSNKNFLITKPKFDNGKKLKDLSNSESENLKTKTPSSTSKIMLTHLSTKNLKTKPNIKFSSIFNKPAQVFPIIAPSNTDYDNSVEKIKRLTYNLNFLRKTNEKFSPEARSNKKHDLFKSFKEVIFQ